MFYNMEARRGLSSRRGQEGVTKRGRIHAALPVQMGGTAPGRCSDCGNDAYIQLAGEAEMPCAHCYGKRLGIAPSPRPKGGEAAPKPTTPRETASPGRRRLSRRPSLSQF